MTDKSTARSIHNLPTQSLPTQSLPTQSLSTQSRSSLTLLLAATSLAAVFACGTGDENDADDAAGDVTEQQTDTNQPAAPVPGGPTPNGLAVPAGVQDWGVIGAAVVPDNGGTLRVIVGNDIAVDAARAGQTNPWPEGTMLSHLQWRAEVNPDDANTIGPGDFAALTLMVKDSSKYAADGNWAYGLWRGPQLMPADAGFDRACVNCHTAEVPDKDYVFTVPGQLPEDAFGAAAQAPNGLNFPSQILDWKVIGIADIINPAGPQLRVLVGNPTAVAAARSGQTEPWPDGSMISHFVWAATTNPETPDNVLASGDFRAITLMQRSSALYTADGNWAYGRWATNDLAPLAADADRDCVGCHTREVSDRDMVFTRMAEFPDSMR